jgi:hypothetical protein
MENGFQGMDMENMIIYVDDPEISAANLEDCLTGVTIKCDGTHGLQLYSRSFRDGHPMAG